MGRILRWSALVLAAVVAIAAAVYVPRVRATAGIGAGFVAKQMCSCMFVGGRSFESCLPDMLEIMEPVRSERVDDGDRRGARAWLPWIFVERFARYEEGFGCTLE